MRVLAVAWRLLTIARRPRSVVRTGHALLRGLVAGSPLTAAFFAWSASSVRAEPTRSPSDAPWSIRGEAFTLGGSGASVGTTTGSFGLTVQRTFFERFAWEETITFGVGNRKVDGSDLGWTFAGTARAAVWRSESRAHAFMLALGSALVLGGGYGKLNFVYGEGGYEFRSARGLRLIVAGGPDVLLTRPSAQSCVADAWLCDTFKRGGFAPVGHLRAGVGWAF